MVEIKDVIMHTYEGETEAIWCDWITEDGQKGSYSFYREGDIMPNKWHGEGDKIGNEKEFVKALLNKWVDSMIVGEKVWII